MVVLGAGRRAEHEWWFLVSGFRNWVNGLAFAERKWRGARVCVIELVPRSVLYMTCLLWGEEGCVVTLTVWRLAGEDIWVQLA